MRLLNARTLQLESYDKEDSVPPYAILSHTWGEEEVLFDDLRPPNAEVQAFLQRIESLEKRGGLDGRQSTIASGETRLVQVARKKGWQKIMGCCKEASSLGISHVWIDTCCIFKDSSAELSESINSMFAWYRDAKICFAYMGDVAGEQDTDGAFESSNWFTRGWTLQELIAPREIMFYRNDWSLIDVRSSLAARIAKITGIAGKLLSEWNLDELHSFSVAARMSWASRRKTTRAEDRAYSLMGLFGVTMSTIYGEGEVAAFFRLQTEIFRISGDHTIFAWRIPAQSRPASLGEAPVCDLLAPSPDVFESSSTIVSVPHRSDYASQFKHRYNAHYSTMTHGMRVQLLVTHFAVKGQREILLAHLACKFNGDSHPIKIGLIWDSNCYRRYEPNTLWRKGPFRIPELTDVYIVPPRPNFAASSSMVKQRIRQSLTGFLTLNEEVLHRFGFFAIDYSPQKGCWVLDTKGANETHLSGIKIRLWEYDHNAAIIYRHSTTGETFAIIIGISRRFKSLTPSFMVGVLDNLHDGIQALSVWDSYGDRIYELSDLSAQVLVERLNSGKWIVASINADQQGITMDVVVKN